MKLFVDTSAWFALNSSTDRNHSAAIEFIKWFQRHGVILYTTDYIVDETVTLIRVKVSHKQAINFLNSALRSKNVIRSQVSRDLIIRAEEIFRKYSDKLWSYTDCVSFAFMDAHGLSDAFAFDKNFSQYGKSVHP
jgi:predicted nucleic acid-binding protein